MSDHPPLARLLSANTHWASDVSAAEPEFFTESAKGQAPLVLWIGCADSRVPETVITGAKPGDIFVHRNIANQVNLDDDSVMSVITYAVDFVGVEHVVVVGHTECGGAMACFNAAKSAIQHGGSVATVPALGPDAPLNRWLAPLTALATSLEGAPSTHGVDTLVEENVRMQVENLCNVPTITKAWANKKSAKGKEVWVHGWVYELASGKLRDLGISIGPQ